MPVNPLIFSEKQSYVMYELYKNMENNLEAKTNLTNNEKLELASVKTNLQMIERYAAKKKREGVRWSLTSLFQCFGIDSTLVLEFYPGSESYSTYGKNLVVNVEYKDEDIAFIFKSIDNKASGEVQRYLKFKTVPEGISGELNTEDIYMVF